MHFIFTFYYTGNATRCKAECFSCGHTKAYFNRSIHRLLLMPPRVNDGRDRTAHPQGQRWSTHNASSRLQCRVLLPIFESDSHGYDTRDFRRVGLPSRAPTMISPPLQNAVTSTASKLCWMAVFNHVPDEVAGRSRMCREKMAIPPTRTGSTLSPLPATQNYNDGSWYEGLEGIIELGKAQFPPRCAAPHFRVYPPVEGRIGIDGLRLDVAYCLDKDFIRALRASATRSHPTFSSSANCSTAITTSLSETACCTPARITSAQGPVFLDEQLQPV